MLQEGPEGGSQEPQACQRDLGAGQDYGVIHPDLTGHVEDNQGVRPSPEKYSTHREKNNYCKEKEEVLRGWYL